jgi:glycerol uptake facilitator-like aquaporin
MARQLISICLATASTILQLFCVIKAREHTSQPLSPLSLPPPPGPPPPVPYNASASVVSAVFLVLLVFLVCCTRSARPQLMLPCINFTIVVVVTSSIAPTLPNLNAALTFAKQLLVINIAGLGLSMAVNLILLPTTNRRDFKQVRSGGSKGSLTPHQLS